LKASRWQADNEIMIGTGVAAIRVTDQNWLYSRRRKNEKAIFSTWEKEIEFRDKPPHTRSGKIMRRLLKAQELGFRQGDTSTLETA